MKTLKFLSIAILFALISSVSYATTYNETRYEVKTSTDLSNFIKDVVKADFEDNDNYFHQNGIFYLEETVLLKFYIDNKSQIRVISSESYNEDAALYLKLLLDKLDVDADSDIANIKYELKLNLDYY